MLPVDNFNLQTTLQKTKTKGIYASYVAKSRVAFPLQIVNLRPTEDSCKDAKYYFRIVKHVRPEELLATTERIPATQPRSNDDGRYWESLSDNQSFHYKSQRLTTT
ncbi:hypothetical protein J6590_009711 [Homalodisca vitripennis]|nr:hypothetical protein J6590_009711 [Homalodisca vitripennis]